MSAAVRATAPGARMASVPTEGADTAAAPAGVAAPAPGITAGGDAGANISFPKSSIDRGHRLRPSPCHSGARTPCSPALQTRPQTPIPPHPSLFPYVRKQHFPDR